MDSIPQADSTRLKHCPACHLDKSLTAFYPSKQLKSGFRSWCIDCERIERDRKRGGPPMLRQPPIERACQQCGKPFTTKAAYVRQGYGRFCSYPCAYDARTRSVAERFWSHVDKSGGPDACWLWTARRTKFGHGLVNRGLDGRGHAASRVAWELTHGPIADGLVVCHNCPTGDNPACCNPAHCFLGTQAENLADARRKERRPSKRMI